MLKFFQKRARDADIEEMQLDIIELRALLNKTLTAVNKQLRAHGRSAQVLADKEETPAPKRPGLMKGYGNKINRSSGTGL